MKTMIGLVVLLIVVLGIIWYSRNNETFLAGIFSTNQSNQEQTNGDSNSENNSDDSDSSNNVNDSDSNSNSSSSNGSVQSSSGLLVCTSELLVQDCNRTENTPVCSVDVLKTGKGEEIESNTDYISACHYCKFFGSSGSVDFGDETLVTKGYTTGSCSN